MPPPVAYSQYSYDHAGPSSAQGTLDAKPSFPPAPPLRPGFVCSENTSVLNLIYFPKDHVQQHYGVFNLSQIWLYITNEFKWPG